MNINYRDLKNLCHKKNLCKEYVIILEKSNNLLTLKKTKKNALTDPTYMVIWFTTKFPLQFMGKRVVFFLRKSSGLSGYPLGIERTLAAPSYHTKTPKCDS